MQDYDASTYGDAFADVYDEWYADISDVGATVDVLHAVARRVDPVGALALLELAVGTGRIAIPLAATGLHVVGVDTSRAMLDRLRAKTGSEAVTAIEADMATGLPDGTFSVVVVAYNSLFALGPADRRLCLAAVAERLVPGGAFVVEAFVPDDRPAGGTVGVRSMSARHVVLSVDVNVPDENRAEGHFIEITEAGGVRLRPWSVHYAHPDEIDAEAAAVGLTLETRHEDWQNSPFVDDSPRHVSIYVRSP